MHTNDTMHVQNCRIASEANDPYLLLSTLYSLPSTSLLSMPLYSTLYSTLYYSLLSTTLCSLLLSTLYSLLSAALYSLLSTLYSLLSMQDIAVVALHRMLHRMPQVVSHPHARSVHATVLSSPCKLCHLPACYCILCAL